MILPRPLLRWAASLLLPLALVIAACAVNPATGERQLSFMSESQEIELGRESDPGSVAQ